VHLVRLSLPIQEQRLCDSQHAAFRRERQHRSGARSRAERRPWGPRSQGCV